MKNTINTILALIILSTTMLFAQDAKVQVIHNSAFPGAAEVDVYINDAKPAALDNFAFRTATPFVDLPSGQDIVVKVAAASSMDANDQIIGTFNLGQLEAGASYVVMANGILGDGFTSPDMERSISFNLYPIAGQTEAMDMNMVDVNVFHGVTDAPAVDIYADMSGDALIPNLDYTESTGYVGLPPANYNLTLTVAGNKEAKAGTFNADLSGLAGGAAVVFASGFLSPDSQTPEIPMGYGFGLFAALADGTVIELPMVIEEETAKVQVIHNSAFPGAAEVDVYINDAKPAALDNFAFRTATPFVDLPSGQDIVVKVAAASSMDANDQIIGTFNLGQLEAGVSYVVMANGILGDGFTSPDMERSISFNLYPIAGQTKAMDMNMVDVNVFHGVTDAPAVDIYADMNGDALIPNLDYTESTGYVGLPPANYNLTLTVAGNKEAKAGTFNADLSGLAGGAAVVFASGFLSPDSQTPEIPMGYGFGLFAALADGTVIELPMVIEEETAKVQVIHNSAFPGAAEVDVYINDAKPAALDNFAFRTATPFVDLPSGQDIVVKVAAASSMDANDQIIGTFNLGQLEAGVSYVVMANGILGDGFTSPDMERSISFNLYPIAGQTKAMDMNMVDVNVFHGVTDAPAVDIYADMNGDALIPNLDYTESTGYVGLPPANYNLTLTVAGNKEAKAGTFNADLSGLAGGAAVVFASGFLSPDSQTPEIPMGYGFGLYAALADGTVIELPESTVADVIDIDEANLDFNLYPIPSLDYLNIKSTGKLIEGVELYDFYGKIVQKHFANNTEIKMDLRGLASGTYLVRINSGQNIYTKQILVF